MKSGLENYYFSSKKTRIAKNCHNFVEKEILFTHNPKRTRDYFLIDTRFIMPEIPSKNHSLTGFRHSHFFVFFLFNFYTHKWILFPFQQTIPNTLKYSKRTTFLCHWNPKKKRIVTWISYQSSFCFLFFFFFFVDRKNRERVGCVGAPPWNGGASRTKKRLSLKTFGSLFCFAIYIIISI